MTGSCTIDGVDIAAYGAFIERGGSDDFLSFPDRRTPDFNDWAEYDGLDVDLSDLSFQPKRVSVNYVILGKDETAFKHRLNGFQSLHYQPGYRQVYVKEFNRTFELRFVGFSRYRHSGGVANSRSKTGYLTADYVMDTPLQLYTDTSDTPVDGRVNQSHVQIDERDLAEYGIIVNEAYSSVLKPRSAKEPLSLQSHYRDGQWTDVEDEPRKRPREIMIDCTMIAQSAGALLTNLTALFNAVRRTPVKLDAAGDRMACYYTKMSRFQKEAPFFRRVRVSFTLHLQEFSEIQVHRLLAAEAGQVVMTENEIFIDLEY